MSMREALSWATGRAWAALGLAAGVAMSPGLAGCSDEKSATELNPDGPPMVRQLFVREKIFVGEGAVVERTGLAFGDHPDIPSPEESSSEGDDRMVTAGKAFGGDVGFRIIFDELLRGNDLEEILCSDEATYSRVPVGTTPDDIEDCAPPDLSECTKVCIGDDGPIGILDRDLDGAVDNAGGAGYRMIDYGDGELGVSVSCDGVFIPLVGAGSDRTFYNPSGNQLIPAGAGINGLGPVIVALPSQGFRTGATCTVGFRPEVVDKDGNRVCAPPGGDPSRDCPGDGDTAAMQFQVEPMSFFSTSPSDGDDGVDVGVDPLLTFVAPLDPETLDAITMTNGAGEAVAVTVTVSNEQGTSVLVAPESALADNTEYTVAVGIGLADRFGGTPPEPFSMSFSTAPAAFDAGPSLDAGAEVDAGPDAAL